MPSNSGPKRPPARTETARARLLDALTPEPQSARDLSQRVSLSDKEILEHLPHLARSLAAAGRTLAILPARCKSCGFRFEPELSRARPSRCPECRSERIEAARFSLEPA
jgi:predicted Zn-ribbon and HTH transcriptional regulator